MPLPGRIELLQQRVEDFQQALKGFEAMRAKLYERRQNATDSAMLRIDEMLKLNARTIKSLEDALATAQRGLRQESEAPFAAPERDTARRDRERTS